GLRRHLGTLSDAGVHLTPEFMSTQRYKIEPLEGTAGAYLRIIYFETEQRELERALMLLASIHLEILEAFGGVFDGVFRRDVEWVRQREEIGRFGRALFERFRTDAEIGSAPASAGERQTTDSVPDGQGGADGPTR